MAHSARFKVIGYFFNSDIKEAIYRNSKRKGKENVPLPGIRNAHAKLEPQHLERVLMNCSM